MPALPDKKIPTPDEAVKSPNFRFSVIPAESGIYRLLRNPAFAGMKGFLPFYRFINSLSQ
jgi:hypothetical protein